jgi:hypothetical protein
MRDLKKIMATKKSNASPRLKPAFIVLLMTEELARLRKRVRGALRERNLIVFDSRALSVADCIELSPPPASSPFRFMAAQAATGPSFLIWKIWLRGGSQGSLNSTGSTILVVTAASDSVSTSSTMNSVLRSAEACRAETEALFAVRMTVEWSRAMMLSREHNDELETLI